MLGIGGSQLGQKFDHLAGQVPGDGQGRGDTALENPCV